MNSFSDFISQLRSFGKNRSGNVAFIAALLAFPTIGGAGYGLDYARAVSYRMKLDAAAYAAAVGAIDATRALRLQYPDLKETEIVSRARIRAQEIFNAQAPRSGIEALFSEIALQIKGETASANASYSAAVPTTFVNIIGMAKLDLAGAANAKGALSTADEKDGFLLRETFEAWKLSQSYDVSKDNYNGWITGGSGVFEIGRPDVYGVAAAPTSKQVMELNSIANTSISKQVFLAPGKYQLRYYYVNRIAVLAYDPLVVCNTTSADLAWANATSGEYGPQTNAIGVYLDPAKSDTPPARFTAADNNIIDFCISSASRWIERNVDINVREAGFYWLTFNGEGAEDSYGGLITDIRMCRESCPGNVASTLPWLPGTLLFHDDMEPPAGSGTAYISDYKLDNSGVRTTDSRWNSIPQGWTTTPLNRVELAPGAGAGGSFALAMDVAGSDSNRAIHRRFLLAPGDYRIDWTYAAADNLGAFGTWCGLGTGSYSTALAQVNAMRVSSSRPADSNIVGLYVDADILRQHPEHASRLGARSKWLDWRGSTSSGQDTLPVQRVDACVHTSSTSSRSSYFHIARTGHYWITFRGEGTADGSGGRIDNVRLLADSGQSGASAVIASGAAAPGTVLTYGGGGLEVIRQN